MTGGIMYESESPKDEHKQNRYELKKKRVIRKKPKNVFERLSSVKKDKEATLAPYTEQTTPH